MPRCSRKSCGNTATVTRRTHEGPAGKLQFARHDQERIGKIKSVIVANLPYTDSFAIQSACLILISCIFRHAHETKRVADGDDQGRRAPVSSRDQSGCRRRGPSKLPAGHEYSARGTAAGLPEQWTVARQATETTDEVPAATHRRERSAVERIADAGAMRYPLARTGSASHREHQFILLFLLLRNVILNETML